MPDKMVRLVAQCNFGTTRYRVGDDGTVVVPEEVAKDLVHGAGFAMADQPLQPEDEIADEIAAAFETDPEV
jgi:hypothetical protein